MNPTPELTPEEVNDAIQRRLLGLDLEAEFTKEGRSWVEADEEGNVVHRGPVADERQD